MSKFNILTSSEAATVLQDKIDITTEEGIGESVNLLQSLTFCEPTIEEAVEILRGALRQNDLIGILITKQLSEHFLWKDETIRIQFFETPELKSAMALWEKYLFSEEERKRYPFNSEETN